MTYDGFTVVDLIILVDKRNLSLHRHASAWVSNFTPNLASIILKDRLRSAASARPQIGYGLGGRAKQDPEVESFK
jgi:hypothetical protein